MTESFVLTPEALAVYKELRKLSANKQDLSKVNFPDEIMKDLNAQIRIASRDRMFYSFLSKYWRLFELAEKHYHEKIDTNDLPHVFGIGFSNFHAYLNPEETKEDELDNLGCIYYMFNFKSTTHRYLISPSTTWRLFSHIFEEHPNCGASIKDERIKSFYNCIDETCEVDFKKLMDYYYAAGGLQGMIDIVAECKLEPKLERSILAIQKMLNDKVIEPIERFVDYKKVPLGIDKKRYDEALENLNVYRPNSGVHNKLIALDIALACYLTGQKIETTFFDDNDTLYIAHPIYRSVANSRQSVEALRRIKGSDETYISCCPQFLSMLILLKKNLAKELGVENLHKRIDYINKKRKCIEKLRNACLGMQQPQRFTIPAYCRDKKRLKKNLVSTHDYLRDLIKFGEQILPTIIEPVLEINEGNPIYHNAEGSKRYNSYVPIETLNLPEKLKYGTVVKEDYESICNAVKYTYKTLYEYATKEKLLENMGFTQKKIDKLTELYNQLSKTSIGTV
ncbi:MAG: hypothetical protein LBI79_02580 [Nitrososphaerota archaeon]|nr:hypothetical protein [Nitrososphaerota archaeon]